MMAWAGSAGAPLSLAMVASGFQEHLMSSLNTAVVFSVDFSPPAQRLARQTMVS